MKTKKEKKRAARQKEEDEERRKMHHVDKHDFYEVAPRKNEIVRTNLVFPLFLMMTAISYFTIFQAFDSDMLSELGANRTEQFAFPGILALCITVSAALTGRTYTAIRNQRKKGVLKSEREKGLVACFMFSLLSTLISLGLVAGLAYVIWDTLEHGFWLVENVEIGVSEPFIEVADTIGIRWDMMARVVTMLIFPFVSTTLTFTSFCFAYRKIRG